MAITLPQGTKEYAVVNVADALGNLVTLAGTTPQYRVLNPLPLTTEKMTWTAAVEQVMKLYCMIDTSVGPWTAGTYRLYVRFTTAPELPVLGPFEIVVDAS